MKTWYCDGRAYSYDRPLALRRISCGVCPRCGVHPLPDCPVCLGWHPPTRPTVGTELARLARWRQYGREVLPEARR